MPLARVERSGVTARAREADCGRDDETGGFLEDATALEGRWRGDVFMVEGRRGVSQDRMLQRLLGIFSFDRRVSRQIITAANATEYGCHGGGGRKKQQLSCGVKQLAELVN